MTTAASVTMTLGGLVKHMALVEADWFAVKLAGQEYGPPWDGVDFDADPDWEWRTGAEDPPEDVYAAVAARGRSLTQAGRRDASRSAASTGLHPSPGRAAVLRPSGTSSWT